MGVVEEIYGCLWGGGIYYDFFCVYLHQISSSMKNENLTLQLQKMDMLYSDIRQIIETSRNNEVRSVDFCRV